MKSDIGVIGLAVMGENLARNILRNGFSVIGFNRDPEKVKTFLEKAASERAKGTSSIAEFVESLSVPRRIVMMVKAGVPTDEVIEQLRPYLQADDVLIDGGNTLFTETERRQKSFEGTGVLYVGSGISGGEEGALWGPSIMPGGDERAWPIVQPILTAIAAKAEDGTSCCDWIGNGGAGHFVKMVHNGIEYGDMQMIAESYALMNTVLGMNAYEIADVFKAWNQGELKSYLIEITALVLSKKDDVTGKPLVDVILDSAEQKGTGKWTSQIALDLGVAAPTIAESVFSRCISALKEERAKAAAQLTTPVPVFSGDRQVVIEQIRKALMCSKVCSYAQGFQLMRTADREHGWKLDMTSIALLWRAGCIIRAQFLNTIAQAFKDMPQLENLLMNNYFAGLLKSYESDWREAVILATRHHVAIPTFSSALSYFDAYRTVRLPANLTQAQRDHFGAHTYRRIDMDGSFHTQW
jgi:6-phosphogluconate dehydrogenase